MAATGTIISASVGTDRRQANQLLRHARLHRPSPSGSGRPMSRRELAEAVNAHVYTTTGRIVFMDAHYIGRLERGQRHWPGPDYRFGLRAALGASTDAELGFYKVRRTAASERA